MQDIVVFLGLCLILIISVCFHAEEMKSLVKINHNEKNQFLKLKISLHGGSLDTTLQHL